MHINIVVFLVGVLILAQLYLKSRLEIRGVPGIVGFILLGFLLSLADHQWDLLTESGRDIFDFLSRVGVITLLFRIGLESNIQSLWKQLGKAGFIWVGDVGLSALLGFGAAYFLLGLPFMPSFFTGIAFTATSVGVSVGVWKQNGKLKTEEGEMLVDVAELDDISGIILMALLFALIPVLRQGNHSGIVLTVIKSGGWVLLKLFGFGLVCLLFSRFLEAPITRYFQRIDMNPNTTMLLLGAFGFMIASLAAALGFSVAIGAFFAGLAYSRDTDAVKLDTAFAGLDQLFSPFFFIGIGLMIDPGVLQQAVLPGLILILFAMVSKTLGDGLTSLPFLSPAKSALIGLSMIPRAEIAMIVMQHGLRLGQWAVPSELFAAMVSVVLITSLVSPIIIQRLLPRIPLQSADPGDAE